MPDIKRQRVPNVRSKVGKRTNIHSAGIFIIKFVFLFCFVFGMVKDICVQKAFTTSNFTSHLSSVPLNMVSMCSEKPTIALPRLSESPYLPPPTTPSPTLPLKQQFSPQSRSSFPAPRRRGTASRTTCRSPWVPSD